MLTNWKVDTIHGVHNFGFLTISDTRGRLVEFILNYLGNSYFAGNVPFDQITFSSKDNNHRVELNKL